jgi:LysM repeat protein
MVETLAGRWIWCWNWRRCDGGDPAAVANRLKSAGCKGAIVKAFDGGYWFDQGLPFRDIGRRLRARGVAAGAWGYLYGEDVAAEATRAMETARYGEADLLVLDVESEFKGRPEAALEVCQRIREAVGPEYPLYFSSFAIARYHQSFPFESFRKYCTGAAPQVYWNAFRWPLAQAIGWTYDDYSHLQIGSGDVFPVGGLYEEGSITYPPVVEVGEFIRSAAARGSRGVSFWSYEHMSNEMWSAMASATVDAVGEDEMTSQEYESLSQQLVAVGARVQRLESEVAALSGGSPAPAPAPTQRTYTVQSGDTLSGIAQKLGLTGWQRLYEVNAGVIGGDPNRIYPGQVLVVPQVRFPPERVSIIERNDLRH